MFQIDWKLTDKCINVDLVANNTFRGALYKGLSLETIFGRDWTDFQKKANE